MQFNENFGLLPWEIERENDQRRGLHSKSGRVSPTADLRMQDKRFRLGRSRHREFERDWSLDVERRRRGDSDELYLTTPRRRARSVAWPNDRNELTVRCEDRLGGNGPDVDGISRREWDSSPGSSLDIDPAPIRAPSIHRDVITHHRHIDHGFEDAPSTSLESSRLTDIDDAGEEEAEYYHRCAMDRAEVGEAHNGVTRNWSMLDLPPGTKRVTIDGIGGASQEISWQSYNGARRSKFIPDASELVPDRERDRAHEAIGKRPFANKDIRHELWTEITKDLVVKEAIERLGYNYKEAPTFFYVFAYLQFDDVARLVDLSNDYRRSRIREIEQESQSMPPMASLRSLPAPPPPLSRSYLHDERFHETATPPRRRRPRAR